MKRPDMSTTTRWHPCAPSLECLPRVVAGQRGILSWESIQPAIRPKVYYRPQTALIALENTHNMAGGTVYPTDVAEEICDKAHAAGIRVHLDGARIFNAATYLKTDVASITRKFDSVQFCVSKGLGAPVGSLIVGSRDFIEKCRPIRKMLGGGMRQAGVLAAAALVALNEGPSRLAVDHENAALLARGLAAIPGIRSGSGERSNEYRHLRYRSSSNVCGGVSRFNKGARGSGLAGRRVKRSHGDASSCGS